MTITNKRMLELEDEATGGPWAAYQPSELPRDIRIARAIPPPPYPERYYVCRLTSSHDPAMSGDGGGGLQPPREEDAAFICAARSYAPWAARLLEEVVPELLDAMLGAPRVRLLRLKKLVSEIEEGCPDG